MTDLNTPEGLAGALSRFGFLASDLPEDAESLLEPGALTASVWDYQVFHGLVADGVCGPITKAHMELPRCCSHPDLMPMTSREYARSRRWPTDEITYGFQNIGDWPWPPGEVRDMAGWVTGEIRKVTRLKFTESASNRAHISIGYRHIDGRGQVLGWMEIPDGSMKQREMRLDSGDSWSFAVNAARGTVDIGRVWLHEWLHGLGVLHISGNGTALMNPVVSHIRTLQSADIAALRQLGYQAPTSGPLPNPTPPTSPGGSQQTIQIEIDGVIRSASLPGLRVTPLFTG